MNTEQENEWKEKLFMDNNVENNPKAEDCFQLAWEYGHSNGYEEVRNYFEDLSKLIR